MSGNIYLAKDILDGCTIAIKLESTINKHQTLEHEFHVLKTLSGGVGFPIIHWFGSEEGYNAMVFDRLGPSLEDLFARSNYKLSEGTVSNLALQLVSSSGYLCINVVHALTQYVDLSTAVHPLS